MWYKKVRVQPETNTIKYMRKINQKVVIDQIEEMLGLRTLNQQLELRTGINFTKKIADIISDPKAVREYDIKQFMTNHFPGAKENCISENDMTLAKLINEFAKEFKIELFGTKVQRSKQIAQSKTAPSLDYYDNKRDTKGHSRLQYGSFPVE